MKVYTITYNEELMLPHFVNHYRQRFPNCDIVVYDNMSTDDTVAIAKYYDCEVIPYNTNDQLSDTMYLKIKNNCWKQETGWVIVADCDELLDITEADLENETAAMITAEAYNMVNLQDDDLFIENITHGVRSRSYDKTYCFNASKIKEINYGPGCHNCIPIGKNEAMGELTHSKKYPAYHYKYINIDYMIARHAIFAGRRSEENKEKGYGEHYTQTPEQIKKEFMVARELSIKIR